MRWLVALVALATPLAAADLSSIGPVYFWPMNGALDQYIAEQATSVGVFAVTVDPSRAKTVMTDHIDAKFFEGMNEIFPSDEEVEPSAEADAEEEEASGSIEAGLTPQRPANRPRGNPRGTVFLVDVETRQVVWSTFLGEFDRRPKRLHREAKQLVDALQKGMATGE